MGRRWAGFSDIDWRADPWSVRADNIGIAGGRCSRGACTVVDNWVCDTLGSSAPTKRLVGRMVLGGGAPLAAAGHGGADGSVVCATREKQVVDLMAHVVKKRAGGVGTTTSCSNNRRRGDRVRGGRTRPVWLSFRQGTRHELFRGCMLEVCAECCSMCLVLGDKTSNCVEGMCRVGV